MQRLLGQDRTRFIIAVCLIGTQAAVLAWLALSGHLGPILSHLCELFQSKEQLRNYVQSWGAQAPLAFILMQILQVVIAPVPGEFTGAVGGFIFGTGPTVVYSTVGLTLGSMLAFLAARIMGLPLVKLAVSQESLEKFHFLTERRGALLALVLFTIPGFPKDILSYILGLSPMGFPSFVLVCALGRIPGTVMLSFTGSAAFEENWFMLAIVSVVCAIVLVMFFCCRTRIDAWVKKMHSDHLEKSAPPSEH